MKEQTEAAKPVCECLKFRCYISEVLGGIVVSMPKQLGGDPIYVKGPEGQSHCSQPSKLSELSCEAKKSELC